VIEAAKVLFQRYGLKKTTMEDIAKFVGKGKSTLYYYFPSKIEIFEAVIENEIRELFESIEIAASKEVTARQKLKVYWLTRLQKLEKMCNLSQVLKEEIMDHAIAIFNLKRKHLHEELA
jgi:AcrR family transcriptional regulator